MREASHTSPLDEITFTNFGDFYFIPIGYFYLIRNNDLTRVDSKDAALTVLVHLGYLAFIPDPSGSKGVCYIPNKEIREEFEAGLEKLGWEDGEDEFLANLARSGHLA